MDPDPNAEFDQFVRDIEPRLRRALVAAHGPQVGREATVDALAWAWSHWGRIEPMINPVGYLYRVGRTQAREARSSTATEPVRDLRSNDRLPWVEPGLEPALWSLTEHQRVAVVLCHGFQWTHQEVAELLELSRSTVQNHVERGLAHLRRALEVDTDD